MFIEYYYAQVQEFECDGDNFSLSSARVGLSVGQPCIRVLSFVVVVEVNLLNSQYVYFNL